MADAAIAFGIVGEVLFGSKDARIQTELRNRSNKKLARAIERAAAAELETQRLRAHLAWRAISQEGANKLVFALSLNKGSVTIEYVGGDPEALNFVFILHDIFAAAGWQVGTNGMTAFGTLIFEIFIPEENESGRDVVRAAFQTAGIPFRPKTFRRLEECLREIQSRIL